MHTCVVFDRKLVEEEEEKNIVVSHQVLQEMGYPLTREVAACIIYDYISLVFIWWSQFSLDL